jgi:hypothetical protein
MRKLKLQMQITVDGYVAGPDGQLDWMRFGVSVARRAWLTPRDVLNTGSLGEMEGWLKAKRGKTQT